MTRLTHLMQSRVRGLAVLAVLAMTAGFARADLTGDLVTGAIVGGPGAFVVVPPGNTVGPGIEFFIEFVGRRSHAVDITGGGSMSVRNVFGNRISTGAGEVLVLGDLDWSPPGRIVGITNFQTNQGPGISIGDVTWTDHEVRLNMSPNIWEIDGFVSWDIVVELDCDPCDMNCDGVVDALDIESFIGLLFLGDEPCQPCTGDVNGDGFIDANDIEGFINCLFP